MDIDTTDIAGFRSALRGTLLQPADAEYEAARSVWNGMIDRRPRFIVRCYGVADVVAAVKFARVQGLRVAVRGGGHNVAGYGTCDGGMVIDMSLMRSVRVDPAAQTAWVQGGSTWRDVDWETTAFGLVTPGGVVSTTGVGGLTLSGGIGWLRGTHGLCIDNLLSVDIVLADGCLLQASETENSDLFWAVRGGGGNFGIVTAFQFRLHPIESELMVCLAVYPKSRAREIIASWRDFMATAPDELLGSIVEFSTLPDDQSLHQKRAALVPFRWLRCMTARRVKAKPGSARCVNWPPRWSISAGGCPIAPSKAFRMTCSQRPVTAATSNRFTLTNSIHR